MSRHPSPTSPQPTSPPAATAPVVTLRPPTDQPITVRLNAADDVRALAQVEIVIPVYNEAAGLEDSIRRLHAHLSDHFPLGWLVTIADNASTDRTWGIACRLASELDGVQAAHLDQKGRGRALRATWLSSDAPVVAYMDVDLSTDLDALLPLVAPLVSGHSDVAIGTRLAPTSRVVRGAKRELISRSYNLILQSVLGASFCDAQCGFKAMRTDVARALLPMVEDQTWFFDTELLVLAEHNGLRIHEVPVDWIDDPDSRVDVVSTASDDLRGVARMVRTFARGRGVVARREELRSPLRTQPDLSSSVVRSVTDAGRSPRAFAALFVLIAASAFAGLTVPLAIATATAAAYVISGPLRAIVLRSWHGSSRGSIAAVVRDHPRRARAVQWLRYSAVSLVATVTSLTVLGTLLTFTTIPAVWANVIATAVGTVPSFELNRRWVWNKRGKRSLSGEIGPFCALSFAGLALSSLFVGIAAAWATSLGLTGLARTAFVEAANVLAFGSLWILQFVILDRVLFGRTPAFLARIIPGRADHPSARRSPRTTAHRDAA